MIIYESEKFKIEKKYNGVTLWTIDPGTSWLESHSIYYEYCEKKKKDLQEKSQSYFDDTVKG